MAAGRRERGRVFLQHHAEGVAEAAVVVLVQQEAGHVAQRQSPEAANRGVRLEAVAQHALRVVEIQLLDDRSIEHDQRFRTRRVAAVFDAIDRIDHRSEEHTSELQSLMRTSYAVFCLKKKTHTTNHPTYKQIN